MKKLLSIVLALVLVLGLAVVPAFADETVRPTSHTSVASLTGISSVTVKGVDAYYEYDNNTGTGVKYIRAKLPNTSTWEDLQSATVVITTTGSAPTVKYNGTPQSATSHSGNAYTYSLNLLNKRYSVTVTSGGNSYTYYLAAGFTSRVAISDSDSLGLVSAVIGEENSSNISVYGSVIQNTYMGNTYYVTNNINWTDTNVAYYVAGQFSSANAVANVIPEFGLGASLVSGGCIYISENSYKYNPNLGSTFSVTNGLDTRTYTVTVQNNSSEIIISADNFKINLSELGNNSIFSSQIMQINNALSDFYDACDDGLYTFYTTDSLMDVMLAFIDFAETAELFSGDTYCSDTYLSTLNDIGEFSAGDYSGWMYIDGEYTPTCGVPMVGAADYPLGSPSNVFTWFFTTNYMNHYSF